MNPKIEYSFVQTKKDIKSQKKDHSLGFNTEAS